MPEERSPLRRAAEQPPCDAEAEALCLNGLFAVPARMAHFDLGRHLLFVEHRAIWRSMRRQPADENLWLATLRDLERDYSPLAALGVLSVLMWSPVVVVDGSDDGCLVFMLALKRLEWCSDARRRIHAASEIATNLWRVPDRSYTPDEKRQLLEPTQAPAPPTPILPPVPLPTLLEQLEV